MLYKTTDELVPLDLAGHTLLGARWRVAESHRLFIHSQNAFVADVTFATGIYTGKIGYKKMDAAVTQWARGGSYVCPDLPGT